MRGSIEQTGNVLWNGTVQVDSGKSYSITTASALHNVGGTYMAIVNDGTFTDTAAGTSTVDASFANNGTLTIGSGATLHLNSGTSSLGGSITGAGTLQFGVGTATIATTTVSVAEMDIVAGTTVLGNDLSYAGTFTTTNGGAQLDLNGHTLTLSGPASLMSTLVTGPGTLAITGSATIGSNFGGSIPGTATLEDAGSIEQTGNVLWNGTVQIDTGKSYTITTASTLHDSGGSTALTVVNNGMLSDTAAGIGRIYASFTNNGVVTVGSGATLQLHGDTTLGGTVTASGGTVEIDGNVGGDGSLVIGDGGTLHLAGEDASAAVTFSTAGTGETLELGSASGLTARIEDFAPGDAIAISGLSSSASFEVTPDGADTHVTFHDGGAVAGTLDFAGSIAGSQFQFDAASATLTLASTIVGTAGDDTLTGTAASETIDGLAGNDTITGGRGADTRDRRARRRHLRLSDAQRLRRHHHRLHQFRGRQDHARRFSAHAGRGRRRLRARQCAARGRVHPDGIRQPGLVGPGRHRRHQRGRQDRNRQRARHRPHRHCRARHPGLDGGGDRRLQP